MAQKPFQLVSPYQAAGDQPEAIASLVKNVQAGAKAQVLLGVTGSGKTFTMANLIEKTQKPTLVLAHNKTLAGQLYQELRDFFPENAVSYFVSYYDYYQPEAYISATDTYIEKEATINDEIDRLRLSATTNLLTRQDVIVVASVSCIYNLGSPADYNASILEIKEGELISRESLVARLRAMQYQNSPYDLKRATFRLAGDTIQVWPADRGHIWIIDTLTDRISKIEALDPQSGQVIEPPEFAYQQPGRRLITINPAKHYVVSDKNSQEASLAQIRADLKTRLEQLRLSNKIIEAYRLEQKVNHDLEQIKEFGFVNGIENYSRYFDGRSQGDPPFTLLDYFRENTKIFNQDGFLTIMDESHMSIPQVRGMYFGDFSRKQNLIKYGFRLPSALDNRPLKFNEFLERNDQFVFVSATPAEWETQMANGKIVEQLIRPTGLVDPETEIRPTQNQIPDLIKEIWQRKQLGQRVLVTVLTKRMAETLTDYLNDEDKMKAVLRQFDLLPATFQADQLPKVAYLHSDVETLDRSDILADLRSGKYDVLIGINLLREGLDLPEVSLVAILDADKEGFLRSDTSLIQTIGRAARHLNGKAILYADRLTGSMERALEETARRRTFQLNFNQKHGITPKTVTKEIREKLLERPDKDLTEAEKMQKQAWGQNQTQTGKKKSKKSTLVQLDKKTVIDLTDFAADNLTPYERRQLRPKIKRRMTEAVKVMDFELAALLRDLLKTVQI
ncbi:MAG: excinuclease ABC subunit UvrB [bacterium]|nr:excinuclease ABC subunit UvrB [bacterium]